MASEYRTVFDNREDRIQVNVKQASLREAREWIKKWAKLQNARIERR